MNYKKISKNITFSLFGLFMSFIGISPNEAKAQSNSPAIPEIEWDITLENLPFDNDKLIGQRFTAKCHPAVVNQNYSGVYGTDS